MNPIWAVSQLVIEENMPILGTKICVPASHRRAIHQRGRSFPTVVLLTEYFLLSTFAILLALMTLTKND